MVKKFCHEFDKGKCPYCNAGVPKEKLVILTLVDAKTGKEFLWQGTEEQYEKIYGKPKR